MGSRTLSGEVSRDPGPGGPGSRIRGPGPQGPPEGARNPVPGSRRVSEDPGPRPGVPREGGFTSTPRAGAPRFPAGSGAPGAPGEVRQAPPGPGAQKPLPGVPGEPRGPGARG